MECNAMIHMKPLLARPPIKSCLYDTNMVDHDALDYKLNLLSFADLLRLKRNVVLVSMAAHGGRSCPR